MVGARYLVLVVASTSAACSGAGSEPTRTRADEADRDALRRLSCVIPAETTGCAEGERYDGVLQGGSAEALPWSLVCREGRAYLEATGLDGEVGAGAWEALGRVTRAAGGCIAHAGSPVRASAFPGVACATERHDVEALILEAIGTRSTVPSAQKPVAEPPSEYRPVLCKIEPQACRYRDPVCPPLRGDVFGWASP